MLYAEAKSYLIQMYMTRDDRKRIGEKTWRKKTQTLFSFQNVGKSNLYMGYLK